MKNSSLIKILRTFSKEEFREFEKFTASQYFSRGRNLIPFLTIIKKYYPSFDSNEFTIENVFTKLFPGKKYDEKKSNAVINTFSHELIKMCREFLAISEFREHTNKKNFFLLKKLFQKKLYGEFEKTYKDSIEYLEENNGGSYFDFIDRYMLLDIFNEYCVETRDYKKAFFTIAAQDETALTFGLIRAYRSFETKHLAPMGYNLDSPPNFSEALIMNLDSEKMLDEIKKSNHKYFLYLRLNYVFYLISEFPCCDEYYYDFKKQVFENIHLYGHTERYILFCRLIAYCIKRLTVYNDEKFQKEEFEIYDRMLKSHIYKWSEKDSISIHFFRNIVLSALSVNELEWLEAFTNKYSNELAPGDRENMRNYVLANLNHKRGNYEKALEDILKIKLDFSHYKLDIKNLKFKIYFEMHLYDNALSVLESMRQYLSTAKEVSASGKRKNKNFIKFAKELLKLKSSSVNINPGYLINEIEKEEFTGSKTWLIDQAGKLLSKKNPFADLTEEEN